MKTISLVLILSFLLLFRGCGPSFQPPEDLVKFAVTYKNDTFSPPEVEWYCSKEEWMERLGLSEGEIEHFTEYNVKEYDDCYRLKDEVEFGSPRCKAVLIYRFQHDILYGKELRVYQSQQDRSLKEIAPEIAAGLRNIPLPEKTFDGSLEELGNYGKVSWQTKNKSVLFVYCSELPDHSDSMIQFVISASPAAFGKHLKE